MDLLPFAWISSQFSWWQAQSSDLWNSTILFLFVPFAQPSPILPGWVFSLSQTERSVRPCGVYVCSDPLDFRGKINAVLLRSFPKTAFHLHCQMKGRKPQMTLQMVGKDSSGSRRAFGRQALQQTRGWGLHSLNYVWMDSSRDLLPQLPLCSSINNSDCGKN